MQLRFGLTLGLMAISLAGCARLGINNHSLDYRHTQSLAPLTVPADMQMRPQQSLYPAPIINQQALQQAPKFSNSKGNRFEMPAPPENTQNTVNMDAVGAAPSAPQTVQDGNGNPLLKIDGSTAEVWKYVVSAGSASNINSAEIKSPYELSVKYHDKTYLLRLVSTGVSNTLGVYNTDRSFADNATATELLTLIAQNWPTTNTLGN